jgi:peroxiredoxin
MAEVPSTRTLPLGSSAPEFSLTDFDGRTLTLADVRGEKGLVVAFVCNHCPFVVHLAREIGVTASVLGKLGLGFVAINSNDIERYPQDGPEKMVEFARANGWTFPYLLDEDQSVAKKYDAACTPDFYVFDEKLKLTYCGQFDDSRPRNGKPVTGRDLRRAADAVILGLPPLSPQLPSTGCSIKWKPVPLS